MFWNLPGNQYRFRAAKNFLVFILTVHYLGPHKLKQQIKNVTRYDNYSTELSNTSQCHSESFSIMHTYTPTWSIVVPLGEMQMLN